VNTYKIFFVDGTEDYFCRRNRGGDGGEVGKGVLEGMWKRGLSAVEVDECLARYSKIGKGLLL
jgi:hypothetical protein